MKDQCTCGGDLERITETNVGIAAGYMARRSVFSECKECKQLYETTQKAIFEDSVRLESMTFPYGGDLTRDEIAKHAHYYTGYVSREDVKEIIRLYRKK